ncbi:MAG TPA: tetratricopeptide repeat protein, partial [Gemmatimonadales bacterium]|nr:tetratricopeptide repeat protein [Gemmatimonadales bacterium]
AAEAERIADVPTTNPEAYRLYLQGRDYAGRPERTRQTFEAARVQFERAVALDPEFALARAALSQAYGQLHWFRFDPTPRAATRQLEEAEAALRLDPDLPQAHLAMGLAHYYGRLEFRKALAEFTIARDALPGDAWTWWWWSMIQRRLGNWPDHLAGLEQVRRLEPRQARAWLEGGITNAHLRRYSAAVKDLDRALELSPDLHEARFGRGITFLLWLGRVDSLRAALDALPGHAELGGWGTVEAQRVRLWILERRADSLLHYVARNPASIFESQRFLEPVALYAGWAHRWRGEGAAADSALRAALTSLDSILRVLPDDPRVHAARGLALAGLGRAGEARAETRWIEESVTYREDAVLGAVIGEIRAQILARLGDVDGAVRELQRLLAAPSVVTVHSLRLDPIWDPIRAHPRFLALLAAQESP